MPDPEKIETGPVAWVNAFNKLVDFILDLVPVSNVHGQWVKASSGRGREYIPGPRRNAVAGTITSEVGLFEVSGEQASPGDPWTLNITSSLLLGVVPSGLTHSGVTGTGVVYCMVAFNSTTDGAVTAREILQAPSMPFPATGIKTVQLASFEIVGDTCTITQMAFGPVNGTICRKWFEPTVVWECFLFPSGGYV